MTVSFYTFTELHEALESYSKIYELEHVAFCPAESMKRTLKRPAERVCRFCGLRKPETKFSSIPHVIPELLGNKYLISDFECDACNAHFSKLENDLANYLGATRAFNRVPAKAKVPTFTSLGGQVVVKQEAFYGVENSTKIVRSSADDDSFTFNLETGDCEIKYLKQPYTPLKVYKALLKIAMSVMPEPHMGDYAHLLHLLLVDEHNILARYATGVIVHELPIAYALPRCHVDHRIDPEAKACTHVFSLYFQNFAFELPIPLHRRDVTERIYEDSEFLWYTRPPLFPEKPDEALLDGYRRQVKDLSGAAVIREEESMTFNMAADAFKNTQVYAPATGELKDSDGILPNIVGLYVVRGEERPTFPLKPIDQE
jgi:hypothetical protein